MPRAFQRMKNRLIKQGLPAKQAKQQAAETCNPVICSKCGQKMKQKPSKLVYRVGTPAVEVACNKCKRADIIVAMGTETI